MVGNQLNLWVLCAVMALSAAMAGPALAGSDKVLYGAPSAWVDVAAIPPAPPADTAPASQMLLDDNQFNFTGPQDELYRRRVVKVTRPEALANNGTGNFSWNPETQSITVHALHIVRDGKVIDSLEGGAKPFLVLRREANLERAMLDGRLTATKQLEGLQVGDVIDMSWTVRQSDPVLKGKSEDIDQMAHGGVAGRVRFRELWPAKAPLRWTVSEGIDRPKLTTKGDVEEFLIDVANARMSEPPRDAPPRFRRLGVVEVTKFASWAEISSLMAPLYRQAETLKADSPIKAEAARIKAATPDPKVRAALALALVEDQVRYLFLGMDEGGYVPASADETWARRFGDCKGKTVLLLALLNELGIEAQPALANLNGNDGLDERLPRMGAFNHVLVLAKIGNRSYLLDGTREGDHHSIDTLPDLHLDWVLPVQDKDASLRRVAIRPLSAAQIQTVVTIDISGGRGKLAPAKIVVTTRGDTSTAYRRALGIADHQQAERAVRSSWATTYPWLTIDTLDWRDDPATGVFALTATGTTNPVWRRNRDVNKLEYKAPIGGARLNVIQKRQPGIGQDAPFYVRFPEYAAQQVNIILPDHGAGYTVQGPEIDKTMIGEEFFMHTELRNGIAQVTAQTRSIAQEFKVSEIDGDNRYIEENGDQDFVVRAPN